MSGTFIKRAHTCDLPYAWQNTGTVATSTPGVSIGDQWRCDQCGAVYELRPGRPSGIDAIAWNHWARV